MSNNNIFYINGCERDLIKALNVAFEFGWIMKDKSNSILEWLEFDEDTMMIREVSDVFKLRKTSTKPFFIPRDKDAYVERLTTIHLQNQLSEIDEESEEKSHESLQQYINRLLSESRKVNFIENDDLTAKSEITEDFRAEYDKWIKENGLPYNGKSEYTFRKNKGLLDLISGEKTVDSDKLIEDIKKADGKLDKDTTLSEFNKDLDKDVQEKKPLGNTKIFMVSVNVGNSDPKDTAQLVQQASDRFKKLCNKYNDIEVIFVASRKDLDQPIQLIYQ